MSSAMMHPHATSDPRHAHSGTPHCFVPINVRPGLCSARTTGINAQRAALDCREQTQLRAPCHGQDVPHPHRNKHHKLCSAHGALAEHVYHVVDVRRAALRDLGRQEERGVHSALGVDFPSAHVVLELKGHRVIRRRKPASNA